ncbi:MAG: LLM class flavin-dependent oxidoreductase [Chloroflexota bacterium]
MKYGLELAAAGQRDAKVLGELAHLAEDSGWDGIFLEDYIVYWDGGATFDPWIALAVMILQTKRLVFGTTVTPIPRRRPWKLARELLTLDHLSDGRIILGVGLGDENEPGFAAVGETIDKKQRAKMLDESLEILAGLWSGAPFSYEGDCYQISEMTFQPKPVQQPRIPIWVGGHWPYRGPAERAARWDGCIFSNCNKFTAEDVKQIKEFIAERRISNAPYDIVVGGRRRPDDVGQERSYIKSLKDAGATWFLQYIPPMDIEATKEQIREGPIYAD